MTARQGGGSTNAVDGPVVRRRPGGRSAAVRDAVRQATLDLLGEVGYDDLQIPLVAERAGVNKTTLYRRWKDKDTLIADVIGDLADDLVPVPDTGSFRGDLLGLLTAVAAILDEPVVGTVVRAHLAVEGDPAREEVRRRFWDSQFHDSMVIVDRAIDRGEVGADVDRRLVLDLGSGPLYFRCLVTGEAVDDAYLACLVDAIVRACGRA